jgi:hypothetical protein
MKQHHYRITVEHIADKDGLAPTTPASLQFAAGNHDEVIGILQRVQASGLFAPDQAAAFALGLKLFGETLLMNRDHPLFAEMGPQFGAFMKRFKAHMAEQGSGTRP